MGGSTSKEERNSTRRSIKGKSKEEEKRRPARRELDEKERVSLAMKMAETEWRKERKRLREEVKRLRKKVEEKEEAKEKQNEWEWVVEQMCLERAVREEAKEKQNEWEWVVEQMCLERAVREEAVERWKKLYFAIKNELDDLIHTTYGETLRQKPQEEGLKTVQELRKEVKVREETIETLKRRIALMDKQRNEKEREIDLLRQSLRILGNGYGKNKAPSSATRNLPIFKTKFIGCK